MALATDTPRETASRQVEAVILTNAVVCYAGSFMGVDMSTGRAVLWADTANYVWKGLAERGATGNTSASPPVEVEMDVSGQVLKRIAVTGVSAQSHVGDLVYGTDDGTLTLTATSNVGPIGEIVRWHTSTTSDVRLFTPQEYRAWLGV